MTKPKHSPEPWKYDPVRGDLLDATNSVICGGWSDDACLPREDDVHRIVACVNFCQQLPTNLLERMLERHVGAKTVLEILRRREHEPVEGFRYCPDCGYHEPDHDDACLTGRSLTIYQEEIRCGRETNT